MAAENSPLGSQANAGRAALRETERAVHNKISMQCSDPVKKSSS